MRLPWWMRRCMCRSYHRRTGDHAQGCPRRRQAVPEIPVDPWAAVRQAGAASPDEIRAVFLPLPGSSAGGLIVPEVQWIIQTVNQGALAGLGLDEMVRGEVVRQLGEMVAPRVAELLSQA